MSTDPQDTTADGSTTMAELLAFEVATRDLVGVALRSVEGLEMSLPQFRLLLALQEHGRSTSTQCAQALGVVGSTVTRLADRLNASGHLSRGTDPSNRSIVTLELTTKGRTLVTEVVTRRRAELARILDRLDPDERAATTAGLHSLHRQLGGEYADDPYRPVPL
ncbi:MarR family winged helix-turn-helix transcriptional regulator [Nocardioides sp. DS6]|uniref:MarR family winged helix-turn-helix transcriptional regulator n=1 Tax=Nocardioides eburneus TaxID=3231482 RepID=A0ABV3SYH5_9ACTN